MSGQHFRTECSCGAVLAQCRCPSPDKRVEVRQGACPRCRQATAPAVQPALLHRFRLGARYCIETTEPQATCAHCARSAKVGPLPPSLIITKIDHAAGTITLSAERAPGAREALT
jgi:hypothetical protein